MGGNTLLLFVRTVIVTLCGAVAVRLAIAALGVDGYGTYATAMGVVGLFMLFKGALEQTARRFVSHEFGRGASSCIRPWLVPFRWRALHRQERCWPRDILPGRRWRRWLHPMAARWPIAICMSGF